MTKKEFYFNEVTIQAEENPEKLLTFTVLKSNQLQINVDCTQKCCEESSISFNRKEVPFPAKLHWDMLNGAPKRITLRLEMIDENGNVLKKAWLAFTGLAKSEILFNDIPKETSKIVLTCARTSNIGKKAEMLLTAIN